jgi:hypothetical protein
MNEDLRCCGSSTCIIDTAGHCWCGQQWDGETMCRPASDSQTDAKGTEPQDEDRDE